MTTARLIAALRKRGINALTADGIHYSATTSSHGITWVNQSDKALAVQVRPLGLDDRFSSYTRTIRQTLQFAGLAP